ncbi:SagB/ThcOx family dehydrogenase [Streptomyces lacrimifluminis]|uniref:SagB-type dehydrogenase domain-containing protein n=1 Tax=Streptomyces lacrimifluminis TaxID=1500077 RepID=A0A917LEE8_9ACTN|nr:SagB-type dehydrogenase domain-containing protein [Streptomyces lacrimifluminis]
MDTGCANGSVVLSGRWGEIRMHQARPVVREALRRMSLGPISLANVMAEMAAESAVRPSPGGRTADRPAADASTEILRVLHRLQHLVVRSLMLEGADQLLLSVVPIAQSARYQPDTADRHRPVRLSRFAFLRSEGEGFVLESPVSLYRVVLHGPEASWVIGMLGRPVTIDEIAAAVPLPDAVIAEIVAHLVGSGMVHSAEQPSPGADDRTRPGARDNGTDNRDRAPSFAEDRDPALLSWSAVDLLFHSRSTLGRHDADFGATYPLADRLPPAPAVKPLPDGPRLSLARPSLNEVTAADPPLTTAVEQRQSIRSYGPERLTATALGEFLYRALRVRGLYEPQGENRHQEGYTDRPYPSGGRAYELEFYLTVRDCVGIPSGIHYYAPLEHCLVQLGDGETDSAAADLLAEAQITAGLIDPPAVVVTITSRIHRLSWKYSGLPYALTLKHVGAVVQNLYLIGTAMGLASCALGSGDVELAARATGTDWLTEPSVGGFALGAPSRASTQSS